MSWDCAVQQSIFNAGMSFSSIRTRNDGFLGTWDSFLFSFKIISFIHNSQPIIIIDVIVLLRLPSCCSGRFFFFFGNAHCMRFFSEHRMNMRWFSLRERGNICSFIRFVSNYIGSAGDHSETGGWNLMKYIWLSFFPFLFSFTRVQVFFSTEFFSMFSSLLVVWQRQLFVLYNMEVEFSLSHANAFQCLIFIYFIWIFLHFFFLGQTRDAQNRECQWIITKCVIFYEIG